MTANDIQHWLNNSYTPAFFRIKVDLPIDLCDLNNVEYGPMSLYFHEYIHFIQDISTVYGLMGISNTSYYVRDAAHAAATCEEAEFKIPHEIQKRAADCGYNNHRTWKFYRGSNINPQRRSVDIISTPKEKITKIDGQELHYVQFLAKDNDTGEEFEFQFGGNIVSEGMAYMCENIVYQKVFENNGKTMNTPKDYPYNICKKIAHQIYPEIADMPIILIAICDISMMNYNPGLMFVKLLEHFKAIDILNPKKKEIKLVTEFISYVYQHGMLFLKGHQYDFEVMQKQVLSELKEYFKVDLFEKNKEWLELLFNRIKVFRKEIPQFVTDIVLFNDAEQGLKSNEIFKFFIRCIGSPMVVNELDECTFMPPEGFKAESFVSEMFWAIHQLYLLFINNNKKLPCSMMEHCRASKDSKICVDERCEKAPWLHATDPGLCPYGAIWKHWGLTGKSPKL